MDGKEFVPKFFRTTQIDLEKSKSRQNDFNKPLEIFE